MSCPVQLMAIPCFPVTCCCYLLRLNLEGFSLRRFLILSVLDLRIIYATSSTIMPIRYIFMFPGAIIALFNIHIRVLPHIYHFNPFMFSRIKCKIPGRGAEGQIIL